MGAPEPPRRREAGARPGVTAQVVAQVVADVAALAGRRFDYVVPDALVERVHVGSVVRVPLHGRRVRGWVVGLSGAAAVADTRLLPIAKVSSDGPSAELVELAEWAAWRWAGPVTRFLATATPARAAFADPPILIDSPVDELRVVRVPPAADPFPLVLEAASRGDALVLAPSLAEAAILAARLRQAGHAVALMPDDWAMAAAGDCTVVGARAAAWAPVPCLAAAVVLDEHDEVYQEERAPTWNARDVVLERARRARVPCVLASPCPSLAVLALSGARLVAPGRVDERAGWPLVEVVDRRTEEPGLGLYSKRVVAVVREAGADRRVVCVLNRKGRSVLLACAACGELARCEVCEGPLQSAPAGGGLACRRCGAGQPAVCRWCGSASLKALRIGVSRAREELELLAGQPVAEVTAETATGPPPTDAAVLVGTSAVLHRVAGAAAVVFLDFDQELLAPRYRAAEEALALLARAGRLVGGRDGRGRVVVQTRLPAHEALDAAVHGDPDRLAVVEGARRAALRLPPEVALARLSGPGAPEVAAALEGRLGIDVLGPSGDRWLVRAADHATLCDALAAAPRPSDRTRVEVDPLRA